MKIIQSQSLFQWTFFCNKKELKNALRTVRSQSLFQWTFFCNLSKQKSNEAKMCVAILILVDFLLQQSLSFQLILNMQQCRNPYFSGLSFAMQTLKSRKTSCGLVAILILVDFLLQLKISNAKKKGKKGRNPYFSGLSFAM